MSNRLTYIALFLYSLGYAALLGLWAYIVLAHVQGAEAIVNYITATLGALTGHILTVLSPAAPAGSRQEPPNGNQAGLASPGLLCALAGAAAALLLAGCSGLNVSWALSATYNTPAVTQVIMTPGVKKADPEPGTGT